MIKHRKTSLVVCVNRNKNKYLYTLMTQLNEKPYNVTLSLHQNAHWVNNKVPLCIQYCVKSKE